MNIMMLHTTENSQFKLELLNSGCFIACYVQQRKKGVPAAGVEPATRGFQLLTTVHRSTS